MPTRRPSPGSSVTGRPVRGSWRRTVRTTADCTRAPSCAVSACRQTKGRREAGPSGRRVCGARLPVAAVGVAVDVDLLARDGLRDRALLRLDVLVEPDALLRHDALLGHRLLGVEHD